jgi:hypothetical protein
MTDFDPTDSYDAGSAWHMLITCDSGCGAMLEFESIHLPGLNYYHEQGQQAKREGWFIEDVSTDELLFRILCPACVKKVGLVVASVVDRKVRPHPTLLTICSMTARPGELAEA